MKRGLMNGKVSTRLCSALYGMLMGLIIPTLAVGPILAQTATLLPDAKQQYLDDAGNPVALGRVDYYIPGTSTRKTVWQDANKTTPQTNGVLLDAAGRPQPTGQTYGDGSYRQKVTDANSLTVWDAVTASTGGSSGGGGTTYIGDGLLVGTIVQTGSFSISAQYLLTFGQAVSRIIYPDLLNAITLQATIICQSGSPVIGGFSDTSRIRIGAKVEASCLPPGAAVIAVGTNTVTMGINATVSANTAARVFVFGNGDGALTFNVPDMRGVVPPGRVNMGGVAAINLTTAYYGADPTGLGAPGGNQSSTLLQTNLPNVNFPVADPGHGHGYQVPGNRTGNNGASPSDLWGAGILAGTTSSAFTGIVVGSGGSGTPVSRIQPSLTLDYMIKAIPDDASLIVGGVTSLGGMQGILACGFGIVCTGNTVSVSPEIVPKTLAPVRLATAAALAANTYANGTAGVGATLTANANGALTVDGVLTLVADRILIKDEVSQLKNGIYTVTQVGSGGTPYILTRATDFDVVGEMLANSNTLVNLGTVNTGARYNLQTSVTTIGTSPVVFFQIFQAGITSISGMVGPLTCGVTLVCAVSALAVNTANNFTWTGNHYFTTGRPWCDPTGFGAVGDNGVTDNYTPIQTCINNLLANYGSGDVLLPPATGVYCVWSKLTIASGSPVSGGITFRGTGQHRSVISGCTSSTTSLNITVLQMNSPWARLENIFVLGYGLRTNDTVVGATVPALVLDTLCTFCKTHNILVNGGNNNVQLLATNFDLKNTETQYAYGSAMIYVALGGGYIDNSHFDQVWPVSVPAYGTALPAWGAAAACNLGDVKSTAGFYIQYTNVAAGVTGGVAPTLKIYGQTITDGTCTALLVAPASYVSTQADTGVNELQMTKIDMTGSFTSGLRLSNTLGGTAPQSVTCTDCVTGQVVVNGAHAAAGTDLVLQNLHVSRCIITGCQAVEMDTGWTGPALVNALRVTNNVGYGVFNAGGSGLTVSNSAIRTAAVSALHTAANTTKFVFTSNQLGFATNGAAVTTAASATVNYCNIINNVVHDAATLVVLGAGSCAVVTNTGNI